MTDSELGILDTPELISRREAVLRVTALLGGVALIGGSALITGCRPESKLGKPFTTDEIAYLDEIADTILPTTSTPGAKAAQTGAFMALMVKDTYSAEDDKTFRDGMGKLNDAMKSKYGKTFMDAAPQQRLEMLQTLDKEQVDYGAKMRAEAKRKSDEFLAERQQNPPTQSANATQMAEEPPTKYFRMMKELALLGYFTSEIGMTQAQRYTEAPGRYDPCIPYDGKPAWASHA